MKEARLAITLHPTFSEANIMVANLIMAEYSNTSSVPQTVASQVCNIIILLVIVVVRLYSVL